MSTMDNVDWNWRPVDWERESDRDSSVPGTQSRASYLRELKASYYMKERLGDIDAMYEKMRMYGSGTMGGGEPLPLQFGPATKPAEEEEKGEEFLFDPKDLDV